MPNRILSEGIKTSEKIDQLSWFEEVLYYRLIVTADDYGCLDGRPIILRNSLFPTKESITKKSIEDAITKLATVGLVYRYEANGMPYLYLPEWELQQRVRNKRRKFPDPNQAAKRQQLDGQLTVNCQSDGGRVSDMCPPESYPILSEAESISEAESEHARMRETTTSATGAQSAIDYFLNRLNPTPSEQLLRELAGYERELGTDVCILALQRALDERCTRWSFVKSILERCREQGMRTRTDWETAEAEHRQKKAENPMPKRKSWEELAVEMEASGEL